MSESSNPTILVNIVKKNKQPHHGGAWKIAYADFVTAMMAFFMLMWLLSMLNKYELQGVSSYFQKPLKDMFIGARNLNDNASFIPPVPNKLSPKVQPITLEKNPLEKNRSEMKQIKSELEASLNKDPELNAFKKHLDFQLMDDGVKIVVHDLSDAPMFLLGKTDLQHYAKLIFHWLGTEFNKIPKKIVIMGFTDSLDYKKNAAYTNWELSVDRANATRRLLVQDGMDEDKIIRISGAADMGLLDKSKGDNPVNRRIEIIILTDKAAKKIMSQ